MDIKLSRKQRRVLSETLARYESEAEPSLAAVTAFFGAIDHGKVIPKDDTVALNLFGAWKTWQIDKESGLSFEERQWLDGHFKDGYSLALLATDFVRDNPTQRQWLRCLPAYQALCRLRARIGSGSYGFNTANPAERRAPVLPRLKGAKTSHTPRR